LGSEKLIKKMCSENLEGIHPVGHVSMNGAVMFTFIELEYEIVISHDSDASSCILICEYIKK
jgi:hypothetical protein